MLTQKTPPHSWFYQFLANINGESYDIGDVTGVLLWAEDGICCVLVSIPVFVCCL